MHKKQVRFSRFNKTHVAPLSLHEVLNKHTFHNTKVGIHAYTRGSDGSVTRRSFTRDNVPDMALRPDSLRNALLEQADPANRRTLLLKGCSGVHGPQSLEWPCVLVTEKYRQDKRDRLWSRFYTVTR